MTRIQWNTWQSLRIGTRDYLYIKQHILSGSRLGRVMDRSGESSRVTWTLTKSKTLTWPGQSNNNKNKHNNNNKLNKKTNQSGLTHTSHCLTYSKLFYKQNHSNLTLSILTHPSSCELTWSQKAIINSQSSYLFLGFVAFSARTQWGKLQNTSWQPSPAPSNTRAFIKRPQG